MTSQPEVIVAVTGASGSCYALRLIERLNRAGVTLHLLFSEAARVVLQQELGVILPDTPSGQAATLAEELAISTQRLHCYGSHDWFAPVASGSAKIRQMVVVPCSMGTLASIANGLSDTLLERAADVMLKERGKLIVVPRETPLSAIHLKNMLTLAQLGATVLPAMPGFYHNPQTVAELTDFMVDRILDQLDLADDSIRRWGKKEERL